MNRILFSLTMASLLATGCAHPGMAPEARAPERAKTRAAKDKTSAADESADASARHAATSNEEAAKGAPDGSDATARKPGDFVVYRFSGSFRKTPLTLTQRVIDRRDAILTVDVTASSGADKRAFRVKINDAPEAKNEVVSVARLESGVEKPASLDAYERLLAEATLAADQNEAFLGTEDVLIDIGGAPLPCHKASYRVRVGAKQATLHTLSSDGFAWGDVGGEITAAGGKVLYRAEVLEAGHTDPAEGSAIANVSPEPF
jgi:hypothetical protein